MKSVKSCEDVGERGKRGYERREVDGDDGSGRNPKAEMRRLLWKVRIMILYGRAGLAFVEWVNRKEACGRSP